MTPHPQYPSPRRLEHPSSVALFGGDALIAFRLLNETRHRIVSGAFGTSRADSNLMTLFVLAAVARGALHAAATPGKQVRKARSSPTASSDTMIGAALARETVNSIAGHPARDAPYAVGLIAIAVTAHAIRPTTKRMLSTARRSLHEVAGAAHKGRAVMRRWGISPSSIQVSLGTNSPAIGGDDAHPGAAATG